jgi:hypothetical protein
MYVSVRNSVQCELGAIFYTNFDIPGPAAHCNVCMCCFVSDATEITSVSHSVGSVMASKTVQMALMKLTVPRGKV